LEEAGKCGKTWSEVQRLAGNSQMEMLHKCPEFLMERKDILLLLLLLLLNIYQSKRRNIPDV
jgi:hypothetical protein